MSRKDSPSLVDGLEAVGQTLTDQERYDVELWERGKALANIVNSFGWDVILDTLKGYEDSAVERLKRIDPAKRDDVLAEHAVMYAAARIYADFVNSVDEAIQASQKAPPALKKGIKKLGQPVESVG